MNEPAAKGKDENNGKCQQYVVPAAFAQPGEFPLGENPSQRQRKAQHKDAADRTGDNDAGFYVVGPHMTNLAICGALVGICLRRGQYDR